MPSRQRSRRTTVVLVIVVVALVGAATVLIVRGLIGSGSATAAPVPATEFSVADAAPRPELGPVPDSAPAGPDDGTRTPDHFSRDAALAAHQVPNGPVRDDHLVIPVLGVDAAVVTEPLDTDNSLILPTDVNRITRWSGSAPLTSTTGTVLIAGHVDNAAQGQGALYWIHTLAPGDLVYFAQDGLVTRWQVTGMEAVHKADLPGHIWAGDTGPRQLVLVTCGGQFLRDGAGRGYYEDNVVVTAVPA